MTLVLTTETTKLLGLTKNQAKALATLMKLGWLKPSQIRQESGLAQGSLYLVLKDLKARDFLHHRKIDNVWGITDKFVKVMHALNEIEIKESDQNSWDNIVQINYYLGKKPINELFKRLDTTNQKERVYSYQGLVGVKGWLETIGLNKILELNKNIKENNIVFERILPKSFINYLRPKLGEKWFDSYSGQATSTSLIDDEYFKSPAEVLIKGNSVYLIWMGKQKIIEVVSEDLAILFKSFFKYISDSNRKVKI